MVHLFVLVTVISVVVVDAILFCCHVVSVVIVIFVSLSLSLPRLYLLLLSLAMSFS